MTKKSTFARNFRYYRERARLGQEALAEKIGVNVRTISVYETGKGYPKVDLLIKISDILDVPVENFFADSPEEAYQSIDKNDGLPLRSDSDASEKIREFRKMAHLCQEMLDEQNLSPALSEKLLESFNSAVSELESTYIRNREIETKLKYATELISSIANSKPFK